MARRAAKMFVPAAPSSKADTKNIEGYPAFKQDLESAYLQMLLTNTFGSVYYASQRELIAEAEKCHGEMLAKDVAFVAKALPYARNKGFMRTQPIYGLARMAGIPEASEFFEATFNDVIRTPNDLNDFFSILRSFRKGEGGRRVKRVAGQWLVSRMNPYWVVKYGAAKSGSYSLRDLYCTLHPKGEKSVLVDYLFGRAKPEELPEMLQAFEELKRADNEQAKIDAIVKGKLPHEVASSFAGTSKKIWSAIVPNMPVFATLRNLQTMERHGVLAGDAKAHVLKMLTTPEVIAKSKILPFRFLEAIKHVNDAQVQDALRDALELSFVGVPEIEGRLAVFLDVSGSMGGFVKTAAVFAISAMKKAKGNGRFLCYNTGLFEVNVSMRDSTLTQASKLRAGGGTDTSLPIRKILGDKDKFDSILLITDEAQNIGVPYVDTLEHYREKVSRDCKCFVLNVAPYHGTLSGQIVPTDPRGLNLHLYGWSDQALAYVSMASRGWNTFVESVRKGDKAEPEPEEKADE
jgi:60 kDa SS-A/Ro ribonucleoprotein